MLIESSNETLLSRKSFDRRNSTGDQCNLITPKNFTRRTVKRKTTIKEDAEFLLNLMSDSDKESKSSLDLNEQKSSEEEDAEAIL